MLVDVKLRKLISDFAIFMSIMSFVGLDMLIGLDTPKLIVPTEFKVFDFSLEKVSISTISPFLITYDRPSACESVSCFFWVCTLAVVEST